MNETITNRQIAFVIFGVVLGYGILGLGKNEAEVAGTTGWLIMLITTIIMTIIVYIISYLGYVHANKTIYEYSTLLVGKKITAVFMIIYFVYYFLLGSFIIRIASEGIKHSILINTPRWAISFGFCIIIYYAIVKGFSTIVRLCEIFGIIIIIASCLIIIAMFGHGDLINLKPFFIPLEIKSFLKAMYALILPFAGVEIIVVIPFDKKKNNKKVIRYTTLITLFIGLLYIGFAEACINVLGIDRIIMYKDSLLVAIRKIEIENLQFLERLDGLFLIAWIMAIYTTVILEIYASVYFISKIVKKNNINKIAFVIVFMAFIISCWNFTFKEVEQYLTYVTSLNLLTTVAIPIILLIITKVKKYDKKNI